MEILCPACQRKLTILEQYAGQQMKCPLCENIFVAPALPAAAGIPLSPPASIPVQPPPPAPAPPAPAFTPSAPVSAAPPQPSAAPPPASTYAASAPAPAPPPEPVPTEHTGRFSIWINPFYLQFVA